MTPRLLGVYISLNGDTDSINNHLKLSNLTSEFFHCSLQNKSQVLGLHTDNTLSMGIGHKGCSPRWTPTTQVLQNRYTDTVRSHDWIPTKIPICLSGHTKSSNSFPIPIHRPRMFSDLSPLRWFDYVTQFAPSIFTHDSDRYSAEIHR